MKRQPMLIVTVGVVAGIALLFYGRERPREESSIAYDAALRVGPFDGSIDVDLGTHRIDAGKVLDLDHVYKLRNVSDQAVTILRVASSCGCTSAEVSKNIVKPGEEFVVKAVI